MKRQIIYFTIIISLFLINPGLVLAGVSNDTIDYLREQPQNGWIIMALGAVGDSVYLPILKDIQLQSATDYERTILAIVSGNGDPRSFYGQDLVNDFENKFYQQGQLGDPRLLNDDFWGILALRSAGESVDSQIIKDSQDFILKHQNIDGGWGYSIDSGSDTNDTAVAIMALLETGLAKNSSVIAKAISYLKKAQNSDGGWPFVSGFNSDTASTAWVISAINKLGQDSNNWLKNDHNPLKFIESLKLTDSSFANMVSENRGSALVTAYAVIALAGKSYPVKSIKLSVKKESGVIIDKAEPQKADKKDNSSQGEPVLSILSIGRSVWSQSGPTPQVRSVTTGQNPKTPWDYIDLDNDGLIDDDETFYRTNPLVADTDADGYLDGEEVKNNYDPLDSSPCPIRKYSSNNRLFVYNQKRLSSLDQEKCRADYLKSELNKRRTNKVAEQYWAKLVNAFIYGGYSINDIADFVNNKKTIHPAIPKSAWQKTWQ